MYNKKIVITGIVFVAVWLFSDILGIVITPLSRFGVNHYIPEVILLALLGFDAGEKWPKRLSAAIAFGIFVCPFIFFIVLGSSFFDYILGFCLGCLFSGFFLLGVRTGRKSGLGNLTIDNTRRIHS